MYPRTQTPIFAQSRIETGISFEEESMNMNDNKGAVVSHVESTSGLHHTTTSDARNGEALEHEMTVMQAVKMYKKAIFWSMFVSLTIIMEGYDTALIGSFYAYPSFVSKYGTYFEKLHEKQITASWQTGLSNSGNLGTLIGVGINGWASQKFGYKPVLLVALVWMAAAVFGTVFAPSLTVLVAAEVLCGVSWGVFATSGPAYASEVMPVVLRGYLTTYVNLCWATGQFISAGVLQGLVSRTDEWAYRIPFAIQWVWPPIIFAVLAFMPESPWHYVRTGDLDKAERSLNRLKADYAQGTTKSQLATMVHTNKLEAEISVGTSYFDCFRGVDLRRTEIVCITFVCQVLSGSAFAYNATYFFSQAGLSTGDAYKMNVGDTAIAFCGTIFSWFLISKFGRRSLFVGGLAVLTVDLALIGICSAASSSVASKWVQSCLSIAWLGIYSSTVGPVCYAIIAETSSTRLRAKSVALARNSYSVVNILANTAEPYLINPSELGLKGKTGFVWMSTCFIALVWSFFRLPECKGRTYEELDILFVKKVSARKFQSTQVDVYNGDADDVLQEGKY